jgi:hypothetical protein
VRSVEEGVALSGRRTARVWQRPTRAGDAEV